MLIIDSMHPEDWPAVRRIYAEGLATGRATFDTEIPEWEVWDAGHLAAPRLVARDDGEVVGWAALGPVSSRPCYRGVAEVSIYVAGAALLKAERSSALALTFKSPSGQGANGRSVA